MDKLRVYVREVMDKKGLSEWQVEKRANRKIKDSYIKDILAGKTKSISVEKLNALAEGLGVDGVELYRIASGKDIPAVEEEALPPGLFVKAVDLMIHDPDVSAIVRALLQLKPAKLKALRKQLE
jgi:transcriptional regulator with XRE-family HTH domain